jgi:hypothetical protein
VGAQVCAVSPLHKATDAIMDSLLFVSYAMALTAFLAVGAIFEIYDIITQEKQNGTRHPQGRADEPEAHQR